MVGLAAYSIEKKYLAIIRELPPDEKSA